MHRPLFNGIIKYYDSYHINIKTIYISVPRSQQIPLLMLVIDNLMLLFSGANLLLDVVNVTCFARADNNVFILDVHKEMQAFE